MRRGLMVAGLLIASAAMHAQNAWDPGRAHSVAQPISQMNPADRHLILQQLKIEANQLTGETITAHGIRTFWVHGNDPSLCSSAHNCKFWVFDAKHRQVLYSEADASRYLPQRHNGRYDIVTFRQAVNGSIPAARWEYNGSVYRQASCVSVDANDATRTHAVPCE